jgi:hypothetical protein
LYGVHIWLVEVYLKAVGIVKYKVYWWFVGRFKNDGGLKGIISGSVVRSPIGSAGLILRCNLFKIPHKKV